MNDFFILMKSELMIVFILFFILFLKLGKGLPNNIVLSIIQLLLLVNFLSGFFFNKEGHLFGNMYTTNGLIVLEKNVLNLGVYLISLLFANWFNKSNYLIEFFILLLSSLLGMFFMISSGNLLIFYLSLELSTIPVAAIANFDLNKRTSSEAGMKLILSSAFSTGLLLFGISLVYGATGTIGFAELRALVNETPLQIFAFILLFAAFAFKLSVVPFHLWTADVYEGSPMAVASFLSVISKGSVAFVFITVLYKVFQPITDVWYLLLVIVSLTTMVLGNLFAVRQQNIKRFLAFSSIAQVGYILIGISNGSREGLAAVIYFVLIYIFSNLAAFGVASVISGASSKEHINDYKGLYKTNPFLSWVLALSLFSLAGIPPTAGFFGKLFLLTAGAYKPNYYWFITIAALNMMISLFYYLKIIRAVFMDKNEKPIAPVVISAPEKFAFIFCVAGVLFVGLMSWVYDYIYSLTALF